jgi:hypothetical protein
MSRRFVAVGIAAAAAAAFAIGVRAESGAHLGFAVENDTTSALSALELAPLSSGRWRTAELDRPQLRPGDSARVRADALGATCEYDVRARFRSGAVIRQDDVNLCDLDSETLVLER